LRLTPEGKLRPCLLRDEEIDIRNPLRSGCDQDVLIDLIQTAVGAKINHCAPDVQFNRRAQRGMSRIGG
jgi:cyclic pyranopterin phosphate synthase